MVRFAAHGGPPAFGDARQSFEALAHQVERQRECLAHWQDTIPRYRQKFAEEYQPLLQAFDRHRIELVRLLDRAFPDKSLSRTDRAKIKDIICSITAEFITHGDENLKPIYNKYSKTDFDSETSEANQAIKSMMQNLLGIELGDDFDIRKAERLLEQIGDKLRQPFEARRARPLRPPKGMRASDEARDASHSIREVFHRLASALHPDGEPDAGERGRKTALMQKANAAYRHRDLLRLLELQLELERFDRHAVDSISQQRLEQYVGILAEQSADLQREIAEVEFNFASQFDFPPAGSLSPEQAMHDLEQDIERIRRDVEMLAGELSALENIRGLKAWLKTYHITKRPYFEDEIFDGIDTDALFGSR